MEQTKTIEEQIKDYAETCKCTLEQAEIRVKITVARQEETHQAKLCPVCKEHSLSIEYDEPEDSSKSWVACQSEDGECEYTTDVTKEHEPLQIWHDFDEIMAFAYPCLRDQPLAEIEKQIGCSWEEFVEKNTKELLETDGWRIGIHIPKDEKENSIDLV